jgi:hypothetical protein
MWADYPFQVAHEANHTTRDFRIRSLGERILGSEVMSLSKLLKLEISLHIDIGIVSYWIKPEVGPWKTLSDDCRKQEELTARHAS